MFGLVALSTDMTIEQDLAAKDVFTTRLYFENPINSTSLENLDKQLLSVKDRFPECVKEIIFGCTSASALLFKEESPFITPLHSALSIMGNKIDLLTPYDEDTHNLVKDWFESKGVEVVREHYMGFNNDFEIANLDNDYLLDVIDRFGSDTGEVFISCTALPVLHLLDDLPNNISYHSSNSVLLHAMDKIRRQNDLSN